MRTPFYTIIILFMFASFGFSAEAQFVRTTGSTTATPTSFQTTSRSANPIECERAGMLCTIRTTRRGCTVKQIVDLTTNTRHRATCEVSTDPRGEVFYDLNVTTFGRNGMFIEVNAAQFAVQQVTDNRSIVEHEFPGQTEIMVDGGFEYRGSRNGRQGRTQRCNAVASPLTGGQSKRYDCDVEVRNGYYWVILETPSGDIPFRTQYSVRESMRQVVDPALRRLGRETIKIGDVKVRGRDLGVNADRTVEFRQVVTS